MVGTLNKSHIYLTQLRVIPKSRRILVLNLFNFSYVERLPAGPSKRYSLDDGCLLAPLIGPHKYGQDIDFLELDEPARTMGKFERTIHAVSVSSADEKQQRTPKL
jgi:hypothetical protein